jgi:hypothetical protein
MASLVDNVETAKSTKAEQPGSTCNPHLALFIFAARHADMSN